MFGDGSKWYVPDPYWTPCDYSAPSPFPKVAVVIRQRDPLAEGYPTRRRLPARCFTSVQKAKGRHQGPTNRMDQLALAQNPLNRFPASKSRNPASKVSKV